MTEIETHTFTAYRPTGPMIDPWDDTLATLPDGTPALWEQYLAVAAFGEMIRRSQMTFDQRAIEDAYLTALDKALLFGVSA